MCGYIIDTYSFELPYLSLVPLRGLNNIDWYSATTQVLEPAATVGRAHSHFSLTSISSRPIFSITLIPRHPITGTAEAQPTD